MHSWMRFSTWTRCFVACLLGFNYLPQRGLAAESGPGRHLALVIGVNVYRPSSGLGPLQHAVKDASRLSAVLRKCGYTVIEMTHEVAREPGNEVLAPNLPNIRDQISAVLGTPNLGKHDSVVITLHGHGVHFNLTEVVTLKGKSVAQRTPKFYFCPADASVRQITSANDLTDRNALLPLDELYEALGQCTAATKLLIVDACRNDPSQAGSFREGEAESLTMPKIPQPPGGLAAFLSCRESQRAVEDKDLGQGGQGVFTHFLIRGLEGKADLPLVEGEPADGVVTLSELTTYTANNTYAYVLKKYPGVQQSPELKGEFDANLAVARVSAGNPEIKMVEKPKPPVKEPKPSETPSEPEKDAFYHYDLGKKYEQGIGVTRDPVEAMKWYRKASDQNYDLAQYTLGGFYERGEGVPQNLAEAIKWYRKASDQNYRLAQYAMAYVYEKGGDGFPKNIEEAIKWYLKASEQNHGLSQFALGCLYQKGDGVPQSSAEAAKWFRKACNEYWLAKIYLAELYQQGDGVPKDFDEAEKLYREALKDPAITPYFKTLSEDGLKAMGKQP